MTTLLAGIVVAPIPVIGVLGFTVVAVVAWRWPYALLIAFFALVPFHFLGFELATSKYHLHVGPLTYWKETLLVVLLVRGVMMRALAASGIDLPSSPADRFLVAYVLVLLLWATMSPFTSAAFNSFFRTAEGPVMVLALVALAPPRRVVLGCLAALTAGALVMAAGALVEQAFPHSFQSWYGYNTASEVFFSHPLARTGYRSGSFFGSSLVLGFFLSGATSMVIVAILVARGWLRAVGLLALAVCLGGVVTTFTRSAFVAVPLGVVITLALAVRSPRVRLAAVGLALSGVLIGTGSFITAHTDRLTHGGDASVHFQLLRHAFDQSMQHPLGFGLGTTDFVAHQYNIEYYVGQSVDSVYGDRLVEGGITILVMYLIALASTAYRLGVVRAEARARDEWTTVALASGALGAFIAVAAAGAFLPVQEQPVTLVAWGSAGLALAAAQWTRGHPASTGHPAQRQLAN